MSRTAIILAAHGAGDGSVANKQVMRLAALVERRLRYGHVPEIRADVPPGPEARAAHARVAPDRRGTEIHVLAAFNLGTPGYAEVAGRTDASRIVVVPLMTSAGYFASVVLPRELRRHPRSMEVEWCFTDPVGVHPRMADLAFEQISDVVGDLALDPADTVGVVVGHGTPRHAASRHATETLASLVARRGGVRSCIAAFLDEDPRIEDVPSHWHDDHLIVLPFLIGGGYHALKDVPVRLRMMTPEDEAATFPMTIHTDGRTIVCTAALGENSRLADIVMDLIERAGAIQANPIDFRETADRAFSTSDSLAGAVLPTTPIASAGPPMPLRLGTRRSALALWQARHVAERLATRGVAVRLIEMTTSGDRDLSRSIADLAGDAPFTDDLDEALREYQIDLAVHSLKDMPLHMPDDLTIAAILKRGDVGESLVSHGHLPLKALLPGRVVGTSSPRRAAQLLAVRPDLRPAVIRGPVDDRVQQVRAGRFDAAILATAGLRRLDLMHEITEELSLSDFLPAPGQGAMAVVVRADDEAITRALAWMDDVATRRATTAELELLRCFESRTDVTVAAHARVFPDGDQRLHMTARLLTLYGRVVWEGTLTGNDPIHLGREAAAAAERALQTAEARAI